MNADSPCEKMNHIADGRGSSDLQGRELFVLAEGFPSHNPSRGNS